jgi:hypothetical protein
MTAIKGGLVVFVIIITLLLWLPNIFISENPVGPEITHYGLLDWMVSSKTESDFGVHTTTYDPDIKMMMMNIGVTIGIWLLLIFLLLRIRSVSLK